MQILPVFTFISYLPFLLKCCQQDNIILLGPFLPNSSYHLSQVDFDLLNRKNVLVTSPASHPIAGSVGYPSDTRNAGFLYVALQTV